MNSSRNDQIKLVDYDFNFDREEEGSKEFLDIPVSISNTRCLHYFPNKKTAERFLAAVKSVEDLKDTRIQEAKVATDLGGQHYVSLFPAQLTILESSGKAKESDNNHCRPRLK